MEVGLAIVIAYLLTGVALVSYDFAAPALHRKGYVLTQDHRVAFISWFIWPLTASMEVRGESRAGRSGVRFIAGVVGVALGAFSWSWLLLEVTLWVLPSLPVAVIFTALVGFFTCPALAFVAMPKHDGMRSRPEGTATSREDLPAGPRAEIFERRLRTLIDIIENAATKLLHDIDRVASLRLPIGTPHPSMFLSYALVRASLQLHGLTSARSFFFSGLTSAVTAEVMRQGALTMPLSRRPRSSGLRDE